MTIFPANIKTHNNISCKHGMVWYGIHLELSMTRQSQLSLIYELLLRKVFVDVFSQSVTATTDSTGNNEKIF